MAVTLEGWTGDQATPLAGRKPLQALIAVSGTGKDLAAELGALLDEVKKSGSSDTTGSPFTVTPVVEGLAPAIVTRLGFAGPSFWTLDIEIGGGAPWPAGVNLLHIAANSDASDPPETSRWSASTFATVIVPAATQTKKGGASKNPQPSGPLKRSRRGT